MNLYLFSVNAVHRMSTGENEVILNFTQQTERSRVVKPGQEGNVVISDPVPLVFAPFMPIRNVIDFFRQIADHLEKQVNELEDPDNGG